MVFIFCERFIQLHYIYFAMYFTDDSKNECYVSAKLRQSNQLHSKVKMLFKRVLQNSFSLC